MKITVFIYKLCFSIIIFDYELKLLIHNKTFRFIDLCKEVIQMALKLMYITNNIDVALIAQKYGVDRIWVDLETLGKEKRQGGYDSVKSHHKISDIALIKPYLHTSEMMVRINKWNDDSVSEIDSVIKAGADIIMLPYWKTIDEVKLFIDAVDYRCKTMLLLETKEACDIIDDVLKLPGIDEIHIGLNDLHLSFDKDFMFELLTDGTVEMLCGKIQNAGLPYGFGGIAKIGNGAVPAEMIILEHYRLGSTRAILSRSFCDSTKLKNIEELENIFCINMSKLRDFESYAATASKEIYDENCIMLNNAVQEVADLLRKRKHGDS